MSRNISVKGPVATTVNSGKLSPKIGKLQDVVLNQNVKTETVSQDEEKAEKSNYFSPLTRKYNKKDKPRIIRDTSPHSKPAVMPMALSADKKRA
jgi:hypothetical protein